MKNLETMSNDSLEKIYITNLPTKGSLKLNNTNVVLNQEINKNDISINENLCNYTD